jgi:hypothetical protein
MVDDLRPPRGAQPSGSLLVAPGDDHIDILVLHALEMGSGRLFIDDDDIELA